MPIDTSELSPEKRAFLTIHPEFLSSLEKQIRTGPYRNRKSEKKKKRLHQKADRLRARAQRLRDKHGMSPLLMARIIEEPILLDILRKDEDRERGPSKLVCPSCGANDRGNTLNGKPWCFKCNSPLVPKDKVKNWVSVKQLPKTLKDEFKRRGLDF